MKLSMVHSPLLSSIQPRLLLPNAAPLAVLNLGGTSIRKRKGGRRRRIATGPSKHAESLRRAAVSFAANLLGPRLAEPLDLLLLLAGGGGSKGGGRRGSRGYGGGGGWFDGWRRWRGRGKGLMGLLVSMALAAALGRTPEKELMAEVLQLGLRNNNRAWRRGIGIAAMGLLVCFVVWSGFRRRRRDGRVKWLRWMIN